MIKLENWTTPKCWVTTLIFNFLILITVYLVCHRFHKEGIEFKQLQPQEISYINDLLSTHNSENKNKLDLSSIENAMDFLQMKFNNDKIQKKYDTVNAITYDKIETLTTKDYVKKALENPKRVRLDNNKDNNDKWDENDMKFVEQHLKGITSAQALTFITLHKFKINSYFWLNGKWAYLEIIFWTLFGVLASHLYAVTNSLRNQKVRNEDDIYYPEDIPSQIAKLIYAPFISLIIMFGYSLFSKDSQSVIDIEMSKGLLITSFILGFYSKRALILLNKLKDILLPDSDSKPTVSNEKKFIISIVIDPSTIDMVKLISDKFTVVLKNSTNAETTELKFNDNANKPKFTGQVKQGTYTVTGILLTDIPINYTVANKINVNDNQEFSLVFVK